MKMYKSWLEANELEDDFDLFKKEIAKIALFYAKQVYKINTDLGNSFFHFWVV